MKNTPKVVALLTDLANLRLSRGWTIDDLLARINQHLAAPIPDTMNGKKQVDRWIHTTRKGWVEPRGEVILAIQAVLGEHSSR